MERTAGTTEFLQDVARAEAASAEQAWSEAASVWAAVTERNPVEGRFWNRLGEARLQAGDAAGAIPAYEQALALRDWYPAESAYAIARCYGRLGDNDAALMWLERALDLGVRSLKQVREEADLAALREHPRFRARTGLIDPAAFSRDEGWRSDLQLLAAEVKRLAYAPFRFLTESTFDAAVAAIDRAIPGLTDLQITIEFEKLLAMLGDGHAGVYPPPDVEENRRAFPLQFYRFEEGLFIVSAGARYGDLLGAEVLAFGETPVARAMEALEPLVCRDNEHWLNNAVPHKLRSAPVLHALGLIPEPDRAELTLRDTAGATSRVNVGTDTSVSRSQFQRHFFRPPGWLFYPDTLAAPVPLYLKNMSMRYWFETLPRERLVYAQINRVMDHPAEPLSAFTERLMSAAESPGVDRLVLDLRWNPGGNTFLEMPLLHRLIGSRTLNQRGRLFVIIGRSTFSAAQNFTTLLERHTEAILVGEPTGSSPTFVGETIDFQLPYSGVWANVSDLLWQSGWPMDERTWVAPLLYTPPTFAAFRENRDPAMEAILDLREQVPGAQGFRWT